MRMINTFLTQAVAIAILSYAGLYSTAWFVAGMATTFWMFIFAMASKINAMKAEAKNDE
jgi:hypothetical protein